MSFGGIFSIDFGMIIQTTWIGGQKKWQSHYDDALFALEILFFVFLEAFSLILLIVLRRNCIDAHWHAQVEVNAGTRKKKKKSQQIHSNSHWRSWSVFAYGNNLF